MQAVQNAIHAAIDARPERSMTMKELGLLLNTENWATVLSTLHTLKVPLTRVLGKDARFDMAQLGIVTLRSFEKVPLLVPAEECTDYRFSKKTEEWKFFGAANLEEIGDSTATFVQVLPEDLRGPVRRLIESNPMLTGVHFFNKDGYVQIKGVGMFSLNTKIHFQLIQHWVDELQIEGETRLNVNCMHRFAKVMPGNKLLGVSSRIARKIDVVSSFCPDVAAKQTNVLIFGAPNSGKTTFLRSYVEYITNTVGLLDCVLVSTCDELGSFDGIYCEQVNEVMCVRTSELKLNETLTNILRDMSMQMIVTDELVSNADMLAAKKIMHRGIKYSTVTHAASLNDLLNTNLGTILLNASHTTLKGGVAAMQLASPPIFDIAIHCVAPNNIRIFWNFKQQLEDFTHGIPITVEERKVVGDQIFAKNVAY